MTDEVPDGAWAGKPPAQPRGKRVLTVAQDGIIADAVKSRADGGIHHIHLPFPAGIKTSRLVAAFRKAGFVVRKFSGGEVLVVQKRGVEGKGEP